MRGLLISLNLSLALLAAPAIAATCGGTADGFAAWKAEFAPEAKAVGVGPAGLAALAATSYSTPHHRR